jgi:hypothetical protein
MTTKKKLFVIVSAIAILFGLMGASFQPALAGEQSAAVVCLQWHTVERGETLTKIAALYNTSWRTLAEINQLEDPNLIYAGSRLCVKASGTVTGTPTTPPVVTPGSGSTSNIRVYASSVKEDQWVTLRGQYLAADTSYSVYLYRYGLELTSAYLVGTARTDAKGAFSVTYKIPKKLVDITRISVTLRNNRGDVATNWFINATAEGNTGGISMPKFSFSLVEVDESDSITIRTSNLPANVRFDVLMHKAGTKGENGINVGYVYDDDGVVKATFEIPEELAGRSKIDIRVENQSLGIFYYMTVENKDQ